MGNKGILEVKEEDKQKIRKAVQDVIRCKGHPGRPTKAEVRERKRRERAGICRKRGGVYKKTDKEKVCPICGTKFVPEKGNKQKTCGNTFCRIKNNENMRQERIRKEKTIKAITNHIFNDMKEHRKKVSERMKKVMEEHPEYREASRQRTQSYWDKKRAIQGNTKLTQEEYDRRMKTMRENKLRKALIAETLKQVLEEMNPETGKTNVQEMSEALIKRVVETGDPAAATFIRDTTGEKPKNAEKEVPMMVMFAPPSQLIEQDNKTIDADFKEINEREQYERLKAKFEKLDSLEYSENNND